MSQQRINQHLNALAVIRRASRSRNEGAVSEAVKALLNALGPRYYASA